MEATYWQGRWARGETGWHKTDVNHYLAQYWPSARVAEGGRVLVPLCGKSLDLGYLASLGHPVLGIEVSPLGPEAFFREAGLTPEVRTVGPYTISSAGGVSIACGDIFDLPALDLSDVVGLYDRASLIALPEELRARYADVLNRCLPQNAHGLTVTIAFDQHRKPGPPFSVTPAEVQRLFGARFRVETLCDDDVLPENPGFIAAGVPSMREHAFALAPID